MSRLWPASKGSQGPMCLLFSRWHRLIQLLTAQSHHNIIQFRLVVGGLPPRRLSSRSGNSR